jgi:predicted acyltransferase
MRHPPYAPQDVIVVVAEVAAQKQHASALPTIGIFVLVLVIVIGFVLVIVLVIVRVIETGRSHPIQAYKLNLEARSIRTQLERLRLPLRVIIKRGFTREDENCGHI